MIEKVIKIIQRHKEIEGLLLQQEIASNPKHVENLMKEFKHLGKLLPTLKRYSDTIKGIKETKQLLKTESDAELIAMAHDELAVLEEQLPSLEHETKILLLPKNPLDEKNALIEIRAGTGGIEAGIFASNLYRMYSNYILARGWRQEIMSTSHGEMGALKEIIFTVIGENTYGTFKFESGVHRVQRVPQTESQGRIHTSAASVAVFPEADDIDITIDPNDLRIDVFRSSGPGGQSVNTTDSAVRIVHLPTSITVTCQDEKSQHKNKAKALKVLKTRLLEIEREKKEAEESATRKTMIGTGDRSVKIRTYNFPQGRVTDHRINLTLYKLHEILDGDIQELLDGLATAEINQQLHMH